jgi:hypothetical protein
MKVPFAVRVTVKIAMSLLPSREGFYENVGEKATQDELNAMLDPWLDGVERVVTHAKNLFREYKVNF